MELHLLTDAVEEPVSLTQVKKFLKLDTADEDDILKILIKSARQQIEHKLGISFLYQEYIGQSVQLYRSVISTNMYPIVKIEEVTIRNEDGSEKTLPEGRYRIHGIRPAKISINDTVSTVTDFPRVVTIKFKAGHATKESVPSPLRLAMLKLVAHNYEFRTISEDINRYQFPKSVSDLISPYKVLTV